MIDVDEIAVRRVPARSLPFDPRSAEQRAVQSLQVSAGASGLRESAENPALSQAPSSSLVAARGHLQTLYGPLFGASRVEWERARWDRRTAIHRRRSSARPCRRALVVLFHGLEGGSGSFYAGALRASSAGVPGAARCRTFAGCSGEPNRLPRAYPHG